MRYIILLFLRFSYSRLRLLSVQFPRINQVRTMTIKTLYTFGYEGLDIDTYIARLIEFGIQTVIDVRELPLSRKKGFSKRAFEAALANAGITYFHVSALGCPKEIRDRFKQDSNWASYTKAFLAYLRTQGSTVRELAKMAKTTTTCLVCFEADFNFCHRTYVARAARDEGALKVMHLLPRKAVPDLPLQAAA